MDKDLNKEAKNYGAFGVYVIWSIRHAVDQCLQTLEVPPFLAHVSICNAFHHVLVQGRQELNTLKVENPVRRADSIWTVSDINAYTEAKLDGDLVLHVLSDGHLVSSSMQQNHNLGFTEQHLPSASYFMADLEPMSALEMITTSICSLNWSPMKMITLA
jgi:hypothetical protein